MSTDKDKQRDMPVPDKVPAEVSVPDKVSAEPIDKVPVAEQPKGKSVEELTLGSLLGLNNTLEKPKSKLRIISHFETTFFGLIQKGPKLYGFADEHGHHVIPCQWNFARDFLEGLAAVNDGNGWGFIDETGKVVVPCRWRLVWDFKNGYAAVNDGHGWGFIDKTGKLMVPCQWAMSRDFIGNHAAVFNGEQWGVIDRQGNNTSGCWFNDERLAQQVVRDVDEVQRRIERNMQKK